MNILFISNEYPPDTGWGGIGTYTRHLARGMAERGHHVQVICRSTDGCDRTHLQDGVTVHRIVPGPYPLPTGNVWYPLRALCYRFIPESLVRLAWARSAALKVAALCGSGTRFDVVECPECGAEGFFLRRLGLPLVVRLHTPWNMIARLDALPGPWCDRMVEEQLERRTVRMAAAVSSPSRALADLAKQRWGCRTITVYPNPIPSASYRPTSGGGWIYTGRIERRKGIEILLRAYATAKRDHPLPVLTLVGRPYGKRSDGTDYGEYIQGLIADLDLSADVVWVRGVPLAEVASFLTRSSVAFFPSLWENFSYACLEAMASGCAVVAARCGGFAEMINDGVSGLLFEAGNEQSLARIMGRIAKEPALATTLGDVARAQVAARFDSRIVLDRAEAFYASLTKGMVHA